MTELRERDARQMKEDAMPLDYDEIVSRMAREITNAGSDAAKKAAIVERFEKRYPELRLWFAEMTVRVEQILLRQKEVEERLADLEARVEQIERMLDPPTRH